MRLSILFVVITALLFSCTQNDTGNNEMQLSGSIEGDYSGEIYLVKREAGDWVYLDTATVENNSFLLKTEVDLPQLFYLSLENDRKYASFFGEPKSLSVSFNAEDISKAQFNGSETNREYEDLKKQIDEFDEKFSLYWNNIKAARESENEEEAAKWEEAYDQNETDLKAFILNYAINNNSSVVGAYQVIRNAYYYDVDDLEKVINATDPSINESVYVVQLNERYDILKRVEIGNPAIDFTMNDAAGNPVTLSSLYGNYLLVDFWASWCGPCRAENPNVLAAYKKYHYKGFDILGVSFDQSKEKWLKAVADDTLTWHHVSDLKGWGNAAGKLYGINSIPANILLDPEGKIIAKNLREEALHEKLKELLNN